VSAVAYSAEFLAHNGFDVVESDASVVVAASVPDAVAALRAGRHVLTDQPTTLESATLLLAESQRSDRVVVVAQPYRHHPMVVAAAAAVRAGRVGLPWNVQADFLVAGGDSVDLAGHPVGVVEALTALPVRRVHAVRGGADTTLLLLDHEHDLTSTIAVGRTGPVGGVPAGGLLHHRYRISGSHGVLLVDALKPAASVASTAGRDFRWLGASPMVAVLDDLHAAITTGRPPAFGPAEAVRTAEVLDAARRSITTGLPVDLQLTSS
jgi:predicted dehydrogenase